jgi:hypothetical protein
LMSDSEVKTSYSSMVLLSNVELKKRANEIGKFQVSNSFAFESDIWKFAWFCLARQESLVLYPWQGSPPMIVWVVEGVFSCPRRTIFISGRWWTMACISRRFDRPSGEYERDETYTRRHPCMLYSGGPWAVYTTGSNSPCVNPSGRRAAMDVDSAFVCEGVSLVTMKKNRALCWR